VKTIFTWWYKLNILIQLLIIVCVFVAIRMVLSTVNTENELFNNREEASIVWLLAFLIWCILREDTRGAVHGVLKALLQAKIIMVWATMILYVCILIPLFSTIGLWQTDLIKDTVLWSLGTAFVYLMNIDQITKSENYFKNILFNNLKLVLVLEFIVNFYTFSFGVEILLIPIIFILVGMSVVAGTDGEYQTVKKIVDFIMAAFGIALLINASNSLLNEFSDFATLDTFRAFILPIAFTFAYLPFLYFWALIMSFENLFVHIDIRLKQRDSKLAGYLKRKILVLCHFNLTKLNRFARECTEEIGRMRNRNDVDNMIQQFKQRNL